MMRTHLIADVNSLLKISSERKNRKIGLINGCFDLVHVGHIMLINEARKRSDVLIIAINSDSSVSTLKGPGRPINSLKERILFLQCLGLADFIVPFSEISIKELISLLKPDLYFKPKEDMNQSEVDLLESIGCNIINIDKKYDQSTSRIIEKVLMRSNYETGIEFVQKYYQDNQDTMRELIKVEYQFLFLYVSLVTASLAFFSAVVTRMSNFRQNFLQIIIGSFLLLVFFASLSFILRAKIKENNLKYRNLAQACVVVWDIFGFFTHGRFLKGKQVLGERAREFGQGLGYKRTVQTMDIVLSVLTLSWIAMFCVFWFTK